MKYAITGATGKFGQSAIQLLSSKIDNSDIIALARNTAKAKEVLPEGVEILPASYEEPEQLVQSLAGVDRLLFISSQPGAEVPRLEQHRNVVNAAKSANVKFIAYTSFPHADRAKAPLASDHKATEALIKETQIPASFLRNNWYLENEMSYIKSAQAGQPFVYSAGDGHVGWALEQDYAQAAAKVLLLDNPKTIYEFAGPSRTYADLAVALQKVTNQSFAIQSVSDSTYRGQLNQAGLDSATIDIISGIQQLIKIGDLAEESTDLTDVLGHQLPSLTDALQKLVK
ncbi:NAD(P)H-binding protein [Paucilactobacillus sp. N302-9]